MDAPFSDSRLAFLTLAALAALLVAALAVAARRSRRTAWALAGILAGAGLLLQWAVLEAIPLSHFTCGPLCGSRMELMPIAIGGAALGAAAVFSVRTRWLPRPVLGVIAFSCTAALLLAGTRFWVA